MHSDIDINPVTLESACSTNGEIFNYFFKSPTKFNGTSVSKEKSTSEDYGDLQSDLHLLVYEMMAREFDNMISRNNLSISTSYETSYGLLDDLYTVEQDHFWQNIQIGDSCRECGIVIDRDINASRNIFLKYCCLT